MQKITLLLPILFLSLFLSCNREEKRAISEVALKSNNSESEFNNKLRHEPKLFLQFWAGMSTEEYFKVYDILVQKRIIVNGFYIADNCKIEIDKVQKGERIIGIKLFGDISCLYPLYEEKYGIPSLIEKESITASFKENNPDYEPKMFYNDGESTNRLPECFEDRTDRLKSPVPIKINTKFSYLSQYLPQNKLIISKETTVIKIEQEILKNNHSEYTYSLDQSEAMYFYKKSEKGEKYFGLGVISNKGDSPANYINSNSKTREWNIFEIPKITITYMSKIDYENELKTTANEKSKTAKLIRNKIIQKEERKKEVLNEI